MEITLETSNCFRLTLENSCTYRIRSDGMNRLVIDAGECAIFIREGVDPKPIKITEREIIIDGGMTEVK